MSELRMQACKYPECTHESNNLDFVGGMCLGTVWMALCECALKEQHIWSIASQLLLIPILLTSFVSKEIFAKCYKITCDQSES